MIFLIDPTRLPSVGLAVLVTTFALPLCTHAQPTPFIAESYSLEYPAWWTYKLQPAPDGSQVHMFVGPQQGGALAYCHSTEQPLLESLAPRVTKMNERQRADFFAASDASLLFSIHTNLASAQGFRLLYAGPAVVGKATPAFTADFFFRAPPGLVYRVRSHFTFWKNGQLSIWCQAVSRDEATADNAFHSRLADFQRLIASVKIKR